MSINYAKKNLSLSLFLVCLLLQSLPYQAADAQTGPLIHGEVTDSYGRPLSKVKILNSSDALSPVVTDTDGTFSIDAEAGSYLIFSHEGFYTGRVKIRGRKNLYIRLTRTYLESPRIIHTLYGTQPANTILGSVSTIYNNQLVTTPAAQYTFALAGRLPGLYTEQYSGWPSQSSTNLITNSSFWDYQTPGTIGAPEPSDNSQFHLSLRGQNPVTIIDGVRRNFYSISPEDIQSVSVLKDALSTILLGQESSRGVLLVTTKRPQKGGPYFSFTTQTAMQTPLDLPDPLSSYKYAWLYNEARMNDGALPIYSQEDFDAYRDGSDPIGHPDVNWYKAVLRSSAPMTRYDLHLSGGGRARYAMGLGYIKKEGLFKEDPDVAYPTNAVINGYTVSTSIDIDVNDYFKVSADIFGRIEDSNQPGAGISAIMDGLLNTPDNAYPIHNPDGSLGGNSRYSNNLYGLATESGYTVGHKRDVLANVSLKYDFSKYLPGLWAKVMGNVSVSSSDFINRSKGFTVFDMNVKDGDTTYQRYGSASDQRNSFSLTAFGQYWYGQLSAGYDKKFGKDSIGAMLFVDQRQVTVNYDLPSKYTNVAAEATYSHDNKYFAELAANYSGYDRFRPGERFGLFYAAGVGWEMAKENFIKNNLPWINRFKWRVTYGLTGNANVGYFVYQDYFDSGSSADFGNVTSVSGEVEHSPLPNPHPTWEKAHKWNAGVDISILKNHLKLTADYYNNKYYDLMETRGKTNPLLGAGYPLENIGINRYEGEEISLTYQGHSGNLNWFITANGSLLKTKVLYMDEVDQRYPWNEHTGLPVGQLFGYVADGLFQNQAEVDNSAQLEDVTPIPGDIKYEDLNKDGVINFFDEKAIGTTKPLIFYGVTMGISFKGFDLNVLFQGVTNRSLLLSGAGSQSFLSLGYGQAWEHDLGRWTPQNAADATSPRVTSHINTNNWLTSTYWIRSGDYIRLKNAEIGYNLPYKWVRRIKLGGVRFFADGLNLFTHSPNKGIDPEISYETSGSAYPIQRVINVGVNIKF